MAGVTTEYLSYNDFLAEASIMYERLRVIEPWIRYGQVYFNLLHVAKPHAAEELRSSALDPYYRNHLEPGVHEFVELRW